MNWITNWVRPKLRELTSTKPETNIPDNLWHKCKSCGQMVYHRELEASNKVCPHCGYHMPLAAKKRLAMLFDDGAYHKVDIPQVLVDPLNFRDRDQRYSEKLKKTQQKLGERDAIMVAHGAIGGVRTVIAIFNFEFMGGSMGMAVGEGFVAAARLAVSLKAPLIAIPASGGARMHEGILSLMQMPRTTVAVAEVKEMGLPYIVIMTDPTTGGVSASFAMLGDIAIAEPGALIGFAGQRVIESTIREKLPPGFQRAEYLLEHGMLDAVVPRHQMHDWLAKTLNLICRPQPGQTSFDSSHRIGIPEKKQKI